MKDHDFEISLLEQVLKRNEDDARVIENLAHLYTHVGRFDDGLQMDLRLKSLCPKNAVVCYNLACSYSLCGFYPEAINALDDAVLHGYDDFDHLMNDEDLFRLRDYPPFYTFLQSNGIEIIEESEA